MWRCCLIQISYWLPLVRTVRGLWIVPNMGFGSADDLPPLSITSLCDGKQLLTWLDYLLAWACSSVGLCAYAAANTVASGGDII